MSVDFYIGEGMTAPDMPATLTNPDGTPINLDTVPPPTVTLHTRRERPPIITREFAVTIVDAANAAVNEGWAEGGFDFPGRYYGYFVVDYADGERVRCPGNRDLVILVTPA